MTTRDDFDALVREATSELEDDERYWSAVTPLHKAPPEEVWILVSPLAQDSDHRLRALVPDVLRYLGGGDKALRPRSIELLRSMMLRERHVLVLTAIAEAFVDLVSRDAVEVLRPLVRHPDSSVRLSATHGIMTSYKAALPELLLLSRDSDAEVRNWATFAIGSQLGVKEDADYFVDTPEVRQALVERLTDPHEETRAEAALGLALRGDARAVPVIEQELQRGSRWLHYLEAAAALPDVRFLPGLERLASSGFASDDLFAALERCRAAASGRR